MIRDMGKTGDNVNRADYKIMNNNFGISSFYEARDSLSIFNEDRASLKIDKNDELILYTFRNGRRSIITASIS